MKLNIKLRNGFDDDKVSIKVDDREVYDKSGVTTDQTIAFADAAEVETDGEEATVTVTVNSTTERKAVNIEETPFIEIWRSGGSLDIRTSKDEVPMM